MDPEKSRGSYIRELLRHWYNQIPYEKDDKASIIKGLLQNKVINHVVFRFQNEILTVHIFAEDMKIRIFELKVGEDLLDHSSRDINFPKILKNSYRLLRNYREISKLKLFYTSREVDWLIVEEIHCTQPDCFSTTLHLVNQDGEIKMSKEKCLPEEKCDGAGFLEEPFICSTSEDSEEDDFYGAGNILRKSTANVPQPCSNTIPTLFEWIIVKCPSFPGKKLYRNTLWPSDVYYYEELRKKYEGTLIFEYVQKADKTVKIDYLTLVAVYGKYLVSFGSVSKSDNTGAFKMEKNRSGFCFNHPEELKVFIIGHSQIRFNEDFRTLYTRENKGVPKKVFELKLTMCNIKSPIQDRIVSSSHNDFLEIFTGPLEGATFDFSHIDFSDSSTDTSEDEIETQELNKSGDLEVEEIQDSGFPKELSEREVKQLIRVTFGHFGERKKGFLGKIQGLHISDQSQEGAHNSQASTQELVHPASPRSFKERVDSFVDKAKEEFKFNYSLLEAKMVLHGAMGNVLQ